MNKKRYWTEDRADDRSPGKSGRNTDKNGMDVDKSGRNPDKNDRNAYKSGRNAEKGDGRQDKSGRNAEKGDRRQDKNSRNAYKSGRNAEKGDARQDKSGRNAEKGDGRQDNNTKAAGMQRKATEDRITMTGNAYKSGRNAEKGDGRQDKSGRNADIDDGRLDKNNRRLDICDRASDADDTEDSRQKIEGRNAVLEAFRSGRTIDRLFVLDGCKDGPVQSILREAKKGDTVVCFVEKDRLNRMSETNKHQGVIAVASAYAYASVADILAKAEEKGEDPFVIVLDGIEDPHNLGAVIRTANLAGAHGVIIPKRRAAGLTAAVAKASAGALNYTPVAKVTNLSQTIRELKEHGIWFVCADMDGELMYRQNLTGPIGLVIGNEGEGVSRLVKEQCDFTASIPMKGEIGSLNASAAAAVLAYEIVRQRL